MSFISCSFVYDDGETCPKLKAPDSDYCEDHMKRKDWKEVGRKQQKHVLCSLNDGRRNAAKRGDKKNEAAFVAAIDELERKWTSE